jgi:signal transduction histidine kinase
MSALALRAAERESMYVERRMENSLLSEVELAALSVERLMTEAEDSLRRDSREAGWAGNKLAGVSFELSGGRLSTFGAADEILRFRSTFEDFLLNGERLPTYDLVTRIYRASENSPFKSVPQEYYGSVSGETAEKPSVPDASGMRKQMAESLLETDYGAGDEIFSQAEREGFSTYQRNVAPQSPKARQSLGGGPRQSVQADLGDMPDLSAKSEPMGSQPGIPPASMPVPDTVSTRGISSVTRSRTVSKNRSFAEAASNADYGMLPRVTGDGLEILFWIKTGGGNFRGCSVRMEMLRDMIADAMPGVISDARILTVLDDSGNPVVTPEAFPSEPPDWGRPFVAREISPLLPRWEAGAWLTDPDALASSARYARTLVWAQVVVLCLVMVAGSVAVVRAMSYEMRLASQKTTFVANVSHELKTPLTSIRLYAELLLSGKQGDAERRREYLRTMMSEADRLAHLVDNVLTFSRRERELNFAPLSLDALAVETVSQAEPRLAKRGFAVTCSGRQNVAVEGNSDALKQVILNLLSNAEKYSGESREISVEYGQAAGRAFVRVMDRGIGVRPGMSEKIFHEFVRGDDSLTAPVSGTGLGLAIARDIARRHGGDVAYSPRDGGGSAFTLILPVKGNLIKNGGIPEP